MPIKVNDDPSKVYRIKFFDCSEYNKIKNVKEVFIKSGAIVQDYRVNYKTKKNLDETLEISFTITIGDFLNFIENLKKFPIWKLSDYSSKY